MDDSKVGLGLGGGGNISLSITNIKQDILGLSNVISNTLQPAVDKLVRSLNSVKLPQLVDSKGNPITSAGAGGGNIVAQNGKTKEAAGGGAEVGDGSFGSYTMGLPKGPTVAGVNNAFQKYVAVSGAINSGLQSSGLMPSVPNAVMQDLLTVRSAFYGQGGYGGNLQYQAANVKNLQKSLAHNGLATDAMDTSRALAIANDTGLSGATNFSQVMQGAATASQFTPGLGISGATQAIGTSLNAPATVNMARVIGINLRSPNGSLLPMNQVVDQIWNFLKQQNGGKGMDKRSIQISLMPGNGIYNMLSGLFNGDPTMIQMTANMLLAKAQFGGEDLTKITGKQLVQAGIQSQTVQDIGHQMANQTNLTVDQSGAISGGYDVSTKMNNAVDKFATYVDRLTGAVGSVNAFNQGILGGPIMAVGSAISKILSIFGLAGGGPAVSTGPVGDGKTPYIVGEVGPELFIPKTDGMIIPNHELPGLNRKNGVGALRSSGGTPQEIQGYLMQALGISAASAAGIVGNLEAESGLNTRAEGDRNQITGKNTSFGIAQWHNGRWTNENKYAAKNKLDPWSVAAQTGFLAQELKGNPTLLATLRQKNISEANAAAYFMTEFEVPQDRSQSAAQRRANLGAQALGGNYSSVVTAGFDSNSTGGPQSGGTYVAPTPTPGASTVADIAVQGLKNQGGGINYGGLTFQFNGITDTNAIITQVKSLINNPTKVIGKS